MPAADVFDRGLPAVIDWANDCAVGRGRNVEDWFEGLTGNPVKDDYSFRIKTFGLAIEEFLAKRTEGKIHRNDRKRSFFAEEAVAWNS